MAWLTIKGAGEVRCGVPLAPSTARPDAARPDAARPESVLPKALLSDALLSEIPLPDVALKELAPLLAAYYGEASPPPLRRIPRYARFGLLAALRALHNADWPKNPELAPHTMLALGTAHSGVEMSMDFMDSLLDQGPRLSSPTAFSHAVNNMGAGLLSLLLDVRGSCQSIAQFSLSFAGALQAATLALHSGRAQRALVGAVDESDPRYARCAQKKHGETLPCVQGATFFCVQAAHGACAEGEVQMRVTWGDPAPAASAPLTMYLAGDATISHAAPQTSIIDGDGCHYGRTSLEHARHVFLAQQEKHSPIIHCHCADARHQLQATIEVRRHI